MFAYVSLVLTLVYTVIVCCNGENITAYVKETLTTTTCETVPRIRDVCNINWKVPKFAAEDYENKIKRIREIISSEDIVYGLNDSEAIDCRKAYESMTCGNYFPVCDSEKLTIEYGDGTARCERTNRVCTGIYIQGCQNSESGERPMVKEEKKCVPLDDKLAKVCPNFKIKVPLERKRFVDSYIQYLSATMKSFDSETKNLMGLESCAKKYKQALCRVIGNCSPDGFYFFYLISEEECEEEMSCVKKFADKVTVDTSICGTLPNTTGLKQVIYENPFSDEPIYEPLKEVKEDNQTKPTKETSKDMVEGVEANNQTKPNMTNKESTQVPHTPTNQETKEELLKVVEVQGNSSEPTKTTSSITHNKVSGKGSASNVNHLVAWFTVVCPIFSLLLSYFI